MHLEVVAVAARKLEDAEEFAGKHGIAKAYGDYAGLASDPDIDVVYVGSIHPCHLALARIYLEAGKNVLCEKPLCMNLKETEELVELARRKKLFLMEAVWSRCIPSYLALRQELAAATVGDVKQVICTFGWFSVLSLALALSDLTCFSRSRYRRGATAQEGAGWGEYPRPGHLHRPAGSARVWRGGAVSDGRGSPGS